MGETEQFMSDPGNGEELIFSADNDDFFHKFEFNPKTEAITVKTEEFSIAHIEKEFELEEDQGVWLLIQAESRGSGMVKKGDVGVKTVGHDKATAVESLIKRLIEVYCFDGSPVDTKELEAWLRSLPFKETK